MSLRVEGDLTAAEVAGQHAWLEAQLPAEGPVVLDLGGVQRIDSAGVALIAVQAKRLAAEGRSLKLTGAAPAVRQTLSMFPLVTPVEAGEGAAVPGWLERIGAFGAVWGGIIFTYLQLFADSAWFMLTGLFKRRGIRWGQVGVEMSQMGSKALGVVGLIAFLVGGTMALQAAVQLRKFGANIFVVDLIAISMTRELGPLMAAIVVAGRSGSSVAAEIGTMVITEEIDALKTMGLHPTRFLVVPKLMAITLTQPLLTMYADLLGILGAFVVGVASLGISPGTFATRLHMALFLKDILTGVFKSVLFAQIIVTIGALCGLRTKGGADAVGRSTTAAVVASIFVVIVADAIASTVFYLGD